MSYRFIALLACLFVGAFSPGRLFATVDGALSGTVLDDKGIAVPDAKVTITGNGVEKDLTTSATGTYQVFPLTLGEYQVSVQADGFNPYTGKVALSGNSTLDIQLVPSTGNEMQMTVTAKRHLVTAAPASSRDLDSSDIEQLPEGATTSLPRLLYTTTAGFVEGDFGQVFTRGNHANLQYQIDGIQLPDSVGGSFGEAFTPVNIDHMEILTGGLQPEFGNRMAGVVNIVTKSGSTEPGGKSAWTTGLITRLLLSPTTAGRTPPVPFITSCRPMLSRPTGGWTPRRLPTSTTTRTGAANRPSTTRATARTDS